VRDAVDDDLFTPALQERRFEVPAEGERPWRLGSQLYVAFFGGPLAAGAIAWMNADKLDVKWRDRRLIVAAAVAGLVAVVVAAFFVDGSSPLRLAVRIAGVVAWGPMYLAQRSADRVYAMYAPDDAYDSMWGPGLACTLGFGLLTALVVELIA